MTDCKWMQDEFCVNADCPMWADYCPVAQFEGVCKYEDREILPLFFKGKRLDTGEYVVGSLVRAKTAGKNVYLIIPMDAEYWGGSEFNISYFVDPHTVEQLY